MRQVCGKAVEEVAGSAPSAAHAIKATGLAAIRRLDYVIVFARDLLAMRRFYETVMRFPIYHEKFPQWIEYRVGGTLLALTQKGVMFDDPETPQGAAAVQLAFRVTPEEVNTCFAELNAAGITIIAEPTDQPWGHRTLFFRDPDGNIIEIYADL